MGKLVSVGIVGESNNDAAGNFSVDGAVGVVPTAWFFLVWFFFAVVGVVPTAWLSFVWFFLVAVGVVPTAVGWW